MTDRPAEVAALAEAIWRSGNPDERGTVGVHDRALAKAILSHLPDHVLVRREEIEALRTAITLWRTHSHELNHHHDARARCETGMCGLYNEVLAGPLARLTPGEKDD
jgi:hypothetical protein